VSFHFSLVTKRQKKKKGKRSECSESEQRRCGETTGGKQFTFRSKLVTDGGTKDPRNKFKFYNNIAIFFIPRVSLTTYIF
jgi:hypothetical protein